MIKRIVVTEKAPQPLGPYSQAIVAEGRFVFVAGQLGIDPKTGKVLETIASQTQQALENIKAVLEAAGTSLVNIVRVGVYLSDIRNWGEMNRVYETFFPMSAPARTTVEAKLDRDFLVEIDCVALIS
jgi:2-iminobutanoate/2-iminopropanoate deaminase